MTLAERTREAVAAEPFLHAALRAGVVNYAAAARYLDVGADDRDAVVAALRRYAADLPARETVATDAPVSMQSGLGPADGDDDALLTVGDTSLAPGAGSLTAIVATGPVDADALRHVLGRLATADVVPTAAGVGTETLIVVVERRDGADALRVVEDALEAVPTGP